MARPIPRVAVRALILQDNRLLLVNAYRRFRLSLWGAPGGGSDGGSSLPDNLIREVREETGLIVSVSPSVALVNEFHDPDTGYHQVDVFFRCTIIDGELRPDWHDPQGIVSERRFFAREELESGQIRFKPNLLPEIAWGTGTGAYDPLEVILK